MSSIASRSNSVDKAVSRPEADKYPIFSTLRLMIPKIGVGYLFAMLLSVYNRVMINELKIAATLVGLMYLIYNLMSILQVVNGRYADRRAIFGLRRTPLMFAGLMLSAFALVFLPSAATSFAAGNAGSFIFMIGIMIVFGFGFAMNGDSHNTLIAELTEGKTQPKRRDLDGLGVHHFLQHCLRDCSLNRAAFCRHSSRRAAQLHDGCLHPDPA